MTNRTEHIRAGEWIPVSTRLPEEGDEVLIVFSATPENETHPGRVERHMAEYVDTAWFSPDGARFNAGSYWEVTHWMPLPDPPELGVLSEAKQTEPKPKRIQRKRSKGWKMPEGAVCVTRPGEWGNQFRISRVTVIPTAAHPEGGESWLVICEPHVWTFTTKEQATDAAIKLFTASAKSPANAKWQDMVRLALRGKDLACWCPLDQPCHADVLLEIANAE